MLRQCLPQTQDMMRLAVCEVIRCAGLSEAAAGTSHPAPEPPRRATPLLKTSSHRVLMRATACAKRARMYFAEGRCALAEAQLDRVRRIAERLVKEDTLQCFNPHFLLLGCLLHSGEVFAAGRLALDMHQTLGDCGSSHLDDPVLHLVLAHTSRRLGRDEVAISVLQAAGRSYPAEPEPSAALALLLRSRGECVPAAAAARLALENDANGSGVRALRPSEREAVARCLEAGLERQGESGDDGNDDAEPGLASTPVVPHPALMSRSSSRPGERPDTPPQRRPRRSHPAEWLIGRVRSKTFGAPLGAAV